MQSKNEKLKRYSKNLLLMGYVTALAIVLMAFEYKTFSEIKKTSLGFLGEPVAEDEILPVVILKKAEAPKPKPKIFTSVEPIKDDTPDYVETQVPELEPTEPDLMIPDGFFNLGNEKYGEEDEEKVWVHLEKQPEFPGGEKALFEYLSKTMIYPQREKEIGIQAKVFVRFVVEKDGRVSNVEILNPDAVEGFKDEATRVLAQMPSWIPGEQNGRKVRAYFTMPISFRLK
jgi:protein TonB